MTVLRVRDFTRDGAPLAAEGSGQRCGALAARGIAIVEETDSRWGRWRQEPCRMYTTQQCCWQTHRTGSAADRCRYDAMAPRVPVGLLDASIGATSITGPNRSIRYG